jgi:hypothetical protein
VGFHLAQINIGRAHGPAPYAFTLEKRFAPEPMPA